MLVDRENDDAGPVDVLGLAGSSRFIGTVPEFLVLAGLGLAALRFVGASRRRDGLEGALGSIALDGT